MSNGIVPPPTGGASGRGVAKPTTTGPGPQGSRTQGVVQQPPPAVAAPTASTAPVTISRAGSSARLEASTGGNGTFPIHTLPISLLHDSMKSAYYAAMIPDHAFSNTIGINPVTEFNEYTR